MRIVPMPIRRLCLQVSERTGLEYHDVKAVLYAIIDEVGKALLRGQSITLKGLGKFYPKFKKGSRGYNLVEKKVVMHKDRYLPAFLFERPFMYKLRETILPDGD